jgi:predicted RNase H-like HicB family nuclease
VTVEQDEDGSYLVRDPLFLLHGVGETPEEALQDYKTAMVEYYALVEAGARDNPYDAAMLKDLTQYVRRMPLDSNHAA